MNYIRTIVGHVPHGVNCAEIAEAVFARLRKLDAVNDLSLLPNTGIDTWPAPTPSVNIRFIEFENPLIMPVSNTVFDEQ